MFLLPRKNSIFMARFYISPGYLFCSILWYTGTATGTRKHKVVSHCKWYKSTSHSQPQPNRSYASLMLNIDRSVSFRTRSSLSILSCVNRSSKYRQIEGTEIYLASIRASSPSTRKAGLGVTASMTKWLSQWGQYSSLSIPCQDKRFTQDIYQKRKAMAYVSSNSVASLRKHFLHFLQANVCILKVSINMCWLFRIYRWEKRTISVVFFKGCVSCSRWHSAQSNHFRPGRDNGIRFLNR